MGVSEEVVSEVIRCVLLCMVEAVEGALSLPEAMEVMEVSEVMRGVRRVTLEGGLSLGVSKFPL